MNAERETMFSAPYRRLDQFVRDNLTGDYVAFSRNEARELIEDFDWHFRDVEMVRRMATFGPGPETSAEQALDVIRIWAENRLARAWPSCGPGRADD